MKSLPIAALLAAFTIASLATAVDLRAQSYTIGTEDLERGGEAEAVVRLEEHRFEVDGPGEARERVRRVVTVLGPSGREAGLLVLPYGRFQEIEKLEGVLRNSRGEVVRKLDDDNVRDLSMISDISLYEESRLKVAELYYGTYPYTVEFEYEVEHDGLIGWPTWSPQWHGVSVEQAWFEIDAPAGMPVRYHLQGGAPEPDVTRGGKRDVYRWAVADLADAHTEVLGPPRAEQLMRVYTAPAQFEIEGKTGSMQSWDAFGRWMHALYEGRAELPSAAQQEVQRLVAEAPTTREKARRLYAYLQGRTRYVSVQLGIGGWQPFDAAYVHDKQYGDCKALTNYMLALLRAADIEAYPALIRTGVGEPSLRAGFPSNQFNHVILAVPLHDEGASTDTLWLETTSQTIPFGHIGAGNEDRHALLVTPEGGELVRTPRSAPAANRQERHATVHLAADGGATVRMRTTYTGNQQDRVRGRLARASGRNRMEWLRQSIDLPTFEVSGADFSAVDVGETTVTIPVELSLRSYASASSSRLFLPLNMLERWTGIPPPVDGARTQAVHPSSYAFADADTVTYVLPEGYGLEAVPSPVRVETPFGLYEARAEEAVPGRLVYTRHLELAETVLPPEQYDAYRAFVRQVVQADQAQAVLVRQPAASR